MKQRLEALTGLRFFAAAAIVMFHTGMRDVLAGNPWTSGLLLYQGVTFFYVLSGFILRYNYQTLDSGTSRLEFFAARIARIYPAYFFFLLVYIFLQPGMINLLKMSPGIDRFVLNVFMLQSWVPVIETHFSFNAVNWSVSTEFFFYICFALFIGANPSRIGRYLLISIIFVILVVWFCNWSNFASLTKRTPNTVTNLGMLNVFPPSRLLEFLVGVWLADYRNWGQQFVQKRSFLLMTTIEVSALVIFYFNMIYTSDIYRLIFPWAPPQFREYYNGISTLPTMLAVIYVFSLGAGGVSKLLGGSIMIFLGEISYSIYLCHVLVISRVKSAWGAQVSFVELHLLIGLITILLAAAVYFCVERPMRKLLMRRFRMAFPSRDKKQMPSHT